MKLMNKADVPGDTRRKGIYHKQGEVVNAVLDFLDSGAEAAEMAVENPNSLSDANAYRQAISRWKLKNQVRVHKYQNHIYLLRIKDDG